MIQYDHPVRVYYRNVDKMNIVYYSRYFEFFEESRTELLRSIGLDVTEIEAEGFLLPVVSAHCDYKLGAGFEDDIIIRTTVPELPKAKLRIEYEVLKDGDLLANGYTIHGFTDTAGKPKRAPDSVLTAMGDYFKS